jgi:hypothetical protein
MVYLRFQSVNLMKKLPGIPEIVPVPLTGSVSLWEN